jgi:hypothetical protein
MKFLATKYLIQASIAFLCGFQLVLAESATTAKRAPAKVRVNAQILDVIEFNPKNNSYLVDLYLVFKPENYKFNANISFMNGKAEILESNTDDSSFLSYRYLAKLGGNIDFRWYPFLSPVLDIAFEDERIPRKEMILVPEPGKLYVSSELNFPGWTVKKITAQEVSDYYSVFNESYSRVNLKIHLDRQLVAAALDNLLPALFIVISGLMCLLITPRYLNERIAVSVASLLSVILIQGSSKADVPSLGYLTYIDKFALVNYAILVGALAESIYVFRISNVQGRAEAKRQDMRLGIGLVVSWALAHALVILGMYL